MKNMGGPPPIILWGGIFVVFLTIVILTVIVEFYFLVWRPTNQLFSKTPVIHSSPTPAPALTTEKLLADLPYKSRPVGQSISSALRRITYHYWYHIGEIQAIRQMLGQAGLPEYVGDIETEAPYRPEV